MHAQAQLLREQPTFSTLPSRVVNRLAAHASLLHVPKGAPVYREGDPGDALYVLVSGRCQSSLASPAAKEHVLELYGPGDSFGERALMAEDRHWSTVRALSDSVVLRLAGPDVQAALERCPVLMRHMARRMNEQIGTLRAPSVRHATPPRHGKATTLLSISADVRGETVVDHVAAALHDVTQAPVLLVHLVRDAGLPALADGLPRGRDTEHPFAFARHTSGGDRGVRVLRVAVRGETGEHTKVAAFIGHLVANFRHVLLHVACDIPSTIAVEFVLQSDEAVILLRQTADDIYRANLLLREVGQAPPGAVANIMPVVCLFDDERGNPRDTLTGQLGTDIHAFIHALPRGDGTIDPSGARGPRDRFDAHVRRLARQIGGCRVGLALSSGGAKSLAHIGVLQVLEENGIEVDAVAGASMGACVAALWACGLDGQAIERLALRLEQPFGLTRMIDPTFPPRRGFMKADTIRRLVDEATGHAYFSDTIRELRIVATDLDTLDRVVFDSGEIAPAVQASMAMPGVVVPVQKNGQLLVDGGATDPLPVDVLLEMGVDRVIAVNTVPNPSDLKACLLITREAPPKRRRRLRLPPALDKHLNYFHSGNVLDVLVRSMMGQESRVAEMACSQADLVLRAISCEGKWHDFRSAGKYIRIGREAAAAHLAELKAVTRFHA